MPDTLRKDLADGIYGIVEAWLNARPKLTEKLKTSRDTVQGWLQRRDAQLPNDFPMMRVEIETLGHSGWTAAQSLASQGNAFKDSTTDFVVVRDVRLVITLRYFVPPRAADENSATRQVSLKDEVVNALFAAGPQLGLSFVMSAPSFKVDERDTRDDEQPKPGKVATITSEFQCLQMGRALLTSINT